MTSNKRNLKENKGVNQGQGQIRKESVEGTTGGVSLKSYLINIAKFTWQHLCESLLLTKLQASAWNLNKTRL